MLKLRDKKKDDSTYGCRPFPMFSFHTIKFLLRVKEGESRRLLPRL